LLDALGEGAFIRTAQFFRIADGVQVKGFAIVIIEKFKELTAGFFGRRGREGDRG
jgi:hypothetical protein